MIAARRTSVAALASVLVLLACEGERGVGPAGVPRTRPADGLLERPELQELIAFQIRRDAAGLINALRSADPAVRARAAFALASVQSPAAVPALAALLDDSRAAVRRDAAFAMGRTAEPQAEPALLQAFAAEQDVAVRRSLVEALGLAGGRAALDSLTERPPGGPLWLERTLAMARLMLDGVEGSAAADSLAAWLDAPDADVRFLAAWFFSRAEDARVWVRHQERIRRALAGYSLDDPAAMHLVSVLGLLGMEADTPALVRWLGQARDWRIRVNAARALEQRTQDPAVREALLGALDHPSAHVRNAAGTALTAAPQRGEVVGAVRDRLSAHPGEWRSAGPLLALLAGAGEADAVLGWVERWPLDAIGPWTRAAPVLAALPGDAARELLLRASGSAEPLVAAAALRALAARWAAERGRADVHEAYFDAFSRAARSLSGAGVAVAVAVLSDSAFVARGSLPVLLGVWERVASGDDPELAGEVLEALGETGDPRAVPALGAALEHPDPRVSDAAAEALLALTGEEVSGARDGGAASPRSGAGLPAPVADARSARARTIDWDFLRSLGPRPRLVLDTEEGRVVVSLLTAEAPVTVQTLARLASEGGYDGVAFHRVVPNFVVQGGDVGRGDGSGGPGFAIPSELTSLRFLRGAAGMASAGKDTEGSQFFLTHSPQPHLDAAYTAFGWVSEGMEVVDRIVEGQRILTATVVPGR